MVAGCSYGGIQTLLGAERGVGYRAAVAISPAALSWEGNPLLRTRLLQAVRNMEIPVMILQPPKDASLEPSRVFGAESKRLGKPFSGKIYPPQGPEDQLGHCFGGAKGMHIWSEDALTFLKQVLRYTSYLLTCRSFSPDGNHLAVGIGWKYRAGGVGDCRGNVGVFDVQSGTILRALRMCTGYVHQVGFSSDGQTVLFVASKFEIDGP